MQDCQNDLVIVSYLDYPYYAGLSTRIGGLTRVLTKSGIKVKVIAPIARYNGIFPSNTSEDIDIQRVDLRRFESKKPRVLASRFIQLLLFSIVASIMVIKDFIKNRCLIQYQSIYSAFPALIAKLFLHARIIGDDIVLMRPFLSIPIIKLSDIVVTPSPRTCLYASFLQIPILYTPNGVAGFLPEKHNSIFPPIVLFVGVLSFDQNLKAVENLVRIASKLDKRPIMFKVLIVGGPLSYVEHLLNHPVVKKGRVKFLGTVSKNKLEELYLSSHVGILPFFQDTPLLGGQRTKALEFFANGLLVISGPEGVRGIHGLEPGKHYLLANSISEMCTIMNGCLSEPEKYRNIANAGASHISANYSWETLAKSYVDLIQSFARTRAQSHLATS